MNYGAAAPANMMIIIRLKKFETDKVVKNTADYSTGPISPIQTAQLCTKIRVFFVFLTRTELNFRFRALREDGICPILVFPACSSTPAGRNFRESGLLGVLEAGRL